MKNILSNLANKGTMCEIHNDPESTNKFTVGRIFVCGEDFIVVEMFDPNGRYDGIGWFPIDTIYHIETDTEYLSALTRLIAHHKEVSKYKADDVADLDKILHLAKCEGRICEFNFYESHYADVTGYIDSFDENIVKVCNINDLGKKDGYSVLSREAITFISIDSCDLVKLEILQK